MTLQSTPGVTVRDTNREGIFTGLVLAMLCSAAPHRSRGSRSTGRKMAWDRDKEFSQRLRSFSNRLFGVVRVIFLRVALF